MSRVVLEDLSIITTNTTEMSVNGNCRQVKMQRGTGWRGWGGGGAAWDLTCTNLASQGPTKGSEGSFSPQTALVSPLPALTSLSASLQGRHLVSEQCFYPREPISSQHLHSCSASPGTQLLLASSELPEHRGEKGQLQRGQAQREAPASSAG